MDSLRIAQENPGKRVVYFGIGFETTAPLTASLIEAADNRNINNLSVLSAHKTMPQAIRQLLKNKGGINALICPGHVAAITGAEAFSFVADEMMLPAAVAGFEAIDIMTALLFIVVMLRRGKPECINTYKRAVTDKGNKEALSLLYQVFEPCDVLWRGLGEIPGSGLKIKERYRKFDAAHHFDIGTPDVQEGKGCICSRILCGESIPPNCVNFGKACTPERPLGACMVSSEGSCAAYYRYKGIIKYGR
jgi:hydrogenase expression/formation protein HypD